MVKEVKERKELERERKRVDSGNGRWPKQVFLEAQKGPLKVYLDCHAQERMVD